jgi:hypothetical protein
MGVFGKGTLIVWLCHRFPVSFQEVEGNPGGAGESGEDRYEPEPLVDMRLLPICAVNSTPRTRPGPLHVATVEFTARPMSQPHIPAAFVVAATEVRHDRVREKVLDSIDALVTVRDGGTADVVMAARRRGLPVMVVWSDGAHRVD